MAEDRHNWQGGSRAVGNSTAIFGEGDRKIAPMVSVTTRPRVSDTEGPAFAQHKSAPAEYRTHDAEHGTYPRCCEVASLRDVRCAGQRYCSGIAAMGAWEAWDCGECPSVLYTVEIDDYDPKAGL